MVTAVSEETCDSMLFNESSSELYIQPVMLFGELLWMTPCLCFQCPQCGRRFKLNNIINLYAPEISVPNNDLEKVSFASFPFFGGISAHGLKRVWFMQQVLSLREKNESLEKQVSYSLYSILYMLIHALTEHYFVRCDVYLRTVSVQCNNYWLFSFPRGKCKCFVVGL